MRKQTVIATKAIKAMLLLGWMPTSLVDVVAQPYLQHMDTKSIRPGLGGGIGYENEMLPIYFDTKAYFSKKTMKVNPWAEAKLGFDTINRGCYFSPTIGIALPLAKEYALTIGLAWGMNTYYEEHNVGLRVGFQF